KNDLNRPQYTGRHGYLRHTNSPEVTPQSAPKNPAARIPSIPWVSASGPTMMQSGYATPDTKYGSRSFKRVSANRGSGDNSDTRSVTSEARLEKKASQILFHFLAVAEVDTAALAERCILELLRAPSSVCS